MNIRRGIILVFVMGGTFLVAHIINAVIAEALSVPVRLVQPSPTSDREAEVRASMPAMVERIRTSGLFPLPPDPLGMQYGRGRRTDFTCCIKFSVEAQAVRGGAWRSRRGFRHR